jgi:hypothetical protein
MAKFLDGPGVQAAMTELIKNTDKQLFIISPYLKISTMMKNYLTSIDRKGLPITITYRPPNTNINDGDLSFFQDLDHLKLYQCENLHSKCYINEKEGIITSMNLHEHSQTHNWEMGIKFSRTDDPEIFADVTKELRTMGTQMKLQTIPKKVAEPQQKSSPAQGVHKSAPKYQEKLAYKPTEAPNKSTLLKILDIVSGAEGYCIRCGTGLKTFDLQKPYCDKCYASWARYKNPKYKEKFCHACGCEKNYIRHRLKNRVVSIVLTNYTRNEFFRSQIF